MAARTTTASMRRPHEPREWRCRGATPGRRSPHSECRSHAAAVRSTTISAVQAHSRSYVGNAAARKCTTFIMFLSDNTFIQLHGTATTTDGVNKTATARRNHAGGSSRGMKSTSARQPATRGALSTRPPLSLTKVRRHSRASTMHSGGRAGANEVRKIPVDTTRARESTRLLASANARGAGTHASRPAALRSRRDSALKTSFRAFPRRTACNAPPSRRDESRKETHRARTLRAHA